MTGKVCQQREHIAIWILSRRSRQRKMYHPLDWNFCFHSQCGKKRTMSCVEPSAGPEGHHNDAKCVRLQKGFQMLTWTETFNNCFLLRKVFVLLRETCVQCAHVRTVRNSTPGNSASTMIQFHFKPRPKYQFETGASRTKTLIVWQ